MNQKIAFYLLSIIAIFFIGYNYSQFNIEPIKREIITIDNSDEIEQYKLLILDLQLQLNDLDILLIEALNEHKKTIQKLNLSSGKIQILEEELSSVKNLYKQIKVTSNQDKLILLEHENTLKKLKEQLLNASLAAELAEFELELLEEQLENQKNYKD
tara:strand:- start:3553 stop:4023 length:471 start_codon:yes stop_codon:yes gene_type:complete